MTPSEHGAQLLELLRHAVGKNGFRNHFAADVDGMGWRSWELLVGLCLARRGRKINHGTTQIFHVSAAGVAMLRKLNPGRYLASLGKPPVVPFEEIA